MTEHRRYRLYTQDMRGLSTLISRYFSGASILTGIGLWNGQTESCAVIEILGTVDDLQSIVFLAGDIKTHHNQAVVIVTWEAINRLDVS